MKVIKNVTLRSRGARGQEGKELAVITVVNGMQMLVVDDAGKPMKLDTYELLRAGVRKWDAQRLAERAPRTIEQNRILLKVLDELEDAQASQRDVRLLDAQWQIVQAAAVAYIVEAYGLDSPSISEQLEAVVTTEAEEKK